MRKLITVFVLMASTFSSTLFAAPPIRLALTPSSTVPLAVIASDMDKKCSNVVLTMDIFKADYLLDATTLTGGGGVANTVYNPATHTSTTVVSGGWQRWEYTLVSSNGDILFHTETTRSKNAIKDVCKFLGAKKP